MVLFSPGFHVPTFFALTPFRPFFASLSPSAPFVSYIYGVDRCEATLPEDVTLPCYCNLNFL